ncbi:MAG: hypothetical protein M3209_00075 [Acidobacteriota bacterium]|nr:hypothetical protein [Acidobacteriota bacterium]
MKNHPETIERVMREIADMNVIIRRKRETLDSIEAATQLAISTEKGEDGKLLFSNETARKSVFLQRISGNPAHLQMSEKLEELEKERLYKLAHVERLKMEFKLYLLDREEEINRLR